MIISGLILPVNYRGLVCDTAFHRPTVRFMDIPNFELQLLNKIYVSKDACVADPATFFDSEAIVVEKRDVQQYFLPILSQQQTTILQLFDAALNFLRTINPTVEGSENSYKNCRFNYSQSIKA